METPAAFTVRGLTKVYGQGHGAVHALRGIDLDIPEGEFVVLLGPSGSGKSTLLNILGGLDRPTAGTLHFRTQDLTACSDRALTAYRLRHVGFVFQFYNLIPSLTARENVSLVTELVDSVMTPEEALSLVGLKDRMKHFPADKLALLNHGLELDGVQLREAKVSWANEDQLRFVLREGRKRQIRRMCEAVGLTVLALKRVRIGRIPLSHLPQGQWRYLAPWEKF